MSNSKGILYVIATPIGNLEDITARAARLLGEVDLVVAEDTRRSGNLLRHLGHNTAMQSYHAHNEREMTPVLVRQLLEGRNLALISDAGTPLISDPGFNLVQAAQAQGIRIVPVPGPTALICALSASGLPTNRFLFEGFAPEKQVARRKYLAHLQTEHRTIVFYEAPHRIMAFIEDAIAVFGEARMAVIARELTKQYETITRATLGDLFKQLQQHEAQRRGEFVVVIQGADAEQAPAASETGRILEALLTRQIAVKEAAAITAEITGAKKNELYDQALKLKERL